MGKETTYTCDRCFHSQVSNGFDQQVDPEGDLRQMWEVGIVVQIKASGFVPESDVHTRAMWCRNCLIETGVGGLPENRENPPKNPPSLEDLIRDIVAEMVEEGS